MLPVDEPRRQLLLLLKQRATPQGRSHFESCPNKSSWLGMRPSDGRHLLKRESRLHGGCET